MSKKDTIPEVDIRVDEAAGVIREVKTRSKKGHERRVNTSIYVILVLMSIIWLAPFVFLVFQSFRSYKLESGGMVNYLLPKQWSLDNYRFLFEGSNFFAWCGKALIACVIAAVVQTGILAAMKNKLGDMSKKNSLLYTGVCLLAGWAVLVVLGIIIMGASVSEALGKIAISLVLYVLVGYLLARSYLKQDNRLLRTIPGYKADEEASNFKKMAMLCLEFLAIGLVLLCVVKPMETSQYLRWYGNTLTIALFVAVLQTIIVLSVSYALSRLRFKGRKLIMNAVLVLGLFPGFLTMITLYFLLKQLGLTGPGSVPGLILIYVASSGMGYYISKGFFDTIPKSLDESARIDGATRFQVFLKIIMPLAKPIVIYTVLMAFMGPWGDYVFASYVAFGNVPSYNVAVGLYQWVNVNDYQGYFTRFCAGGVLVAVPITALFLALQKYYVEGVTGGAVKG
jgi:arabinogalactan oligomer/maltooligosaccharide transport system permease protein